MMRLPGWYTSLLSMRTELRGWLSARRDLRSIEMMAVPVLDTLVRPSAWASSRLR